MPRRKPTPARRDDHDGRTDNLTRPSIPRVEFGSSAVTTNSIGAAASGPSNARAAVDTDVFEVSARSDTRRAKRDGDSVYGNAMCVDEPRIHDSVEFPVTPEPAGIAVAELHTNMQDLGPANTIFLRISWTDENPHYHSDKAVKLTEEATNVDMDVDVKACVAGPGNHDTDTRTYFPVTVHSPGNSALKAVGRLVRSNVLTCHWLPGGTLTLCVRNPLPQVNFSDPPPASASLKGRDRDMWAALSRDLDTLLPATGTLGVSPPPLETLLGTAAMKLSTEDLADQPEGLALELRPYQRRAVNWMLRREVRASSDDFVIPSNPLWMHVPPIPLPTAPTPTSSSHQPAPTLYRRVGSCVFTTAQPTTLDVRGGILADEMGLGKTAEMVACVLLNPRPLHTCWPLASAYGPTGHRTGPTMTIVSTLPIGDGEEDGHAPASSSSSSSEGEAQVDGVERRVEEGERPQAVEGGFVDTDTTEAHHSAGPQPRGVFECFCGGELPDTEPMGTCCVCGVQQHYRCSDWTPPSPEDDASTTAPQQRLFTCAQCVLSDPNLQNADSGLVPIKTTLIISPSMIATQWENEVSEKQAPALKVFRYHGVKRNGFLRPTTLAKYDVVITTYSVLRDEIYHASAPKESVGRQSKSRFTKKYPVIPSAITRVQWWRVCLDEAQMVDSSTSKPAAMAARLSTINRWCVTGTPFSRGVGDLHGLLFFLGAEPFSDAKLWRSAMASPVVDPITNVPRVLAFIAPLLWRNTKENVQSELPLPRQTTVTKRVGLDGIGRYYYNRLHEDCANAASQSIAKHAAGSNGDRLLSDLDQATTRRIAAPLLRLRQACSHPSLAKGNSLMAAAAGGKVRTTMTSVAKSLVDKAKVNCSDLFRKLVLAQNALAALDCLQKRWDQAQERYIRVIETSDAYRKQFTPDPMQLLHAIKNLTFLLKRQGDAVDAVDSVTQPPEGTGTPPSVASPTPSSTPTAPTRDGRAARIQALEERAIKESKRFTLDAMERVAKTQEACRNMGDKIDFGTKEWLVDALTLLADSTGADTLVGKVQQDLASVGHEPGRVATNVSGAYSPMGLLHVLLAEMDRIEKKRAELITLIDTKLKKDPTPQEVAAQSACRTCREDWTRPNQDASADDLASARQCIYCDACDVFMAYEPLVFRHCTWRKGVTVNWEDIEADGKAVDGHSGYYSVRRTAGGAGSGGGQFPVETQGPSETELVLQTVRSAYQKAGGHDTEGMSSFFDTIKWLKQEFVQLRLQWQALFHRVSVLDELAMCGRRLQWWPKNADGTYVNIHELQKHAYVKEHEFAHRMMSFMSDEKEHHQELGLARGRLTYLQQLERQSTQGHVMECAICMEKLPDQYCVLPCGHCFCTECVMPAARAGQTHIKCSLCRQSAPRSLIEHVDVAATDDTSGAATDIMGDLSAKMAAVVRCLKQIRSADFRAKALIFSEWGEVLDLVDVACRENGIPALRLKGSQAKDDRLIHQFKTDPSVCALLLPMKMGSGGLNLTEATHVLLVEPSLNPASERQAVGRVHRIGQTRETCVHRFVITESVEDTISRNITIPAAQATRRASSPERRSPKKRRTKHDDHAEMTISSFRNLFALRRGPVMHGGGGTHTATGSTGRLLGGLTMAGPAAAAAASGVSAASPTAAAPMTTLLPSGASGGVVVGETSSTTGRDKEPQATGAAAEPEAGSLTMSTDPPNGGVASERGVGGDGDVNEVFWAGTVSVPGIGTCQRDKAARVLTMRRSAEYIVRDAARHTATETSSGVDQGGMVGETIMLDNPPVFVFGRTLHHTVAIDLLRLPPCERDGGLLDKAMGDAVQSLLTELEASRRESIQQTRATR
eukprot:m.61902 g.61902  ORF g.61902 m.61902 type:complete len:1838 (-) comp8051_c0_seq2:214-5727(-)